MPYWSERFEWLGYGTINFVDGMGSIIIFAAISILQLLLSAIFVGIRRCTGKNWMQKRLGFGDIFGGSLQFIHGVFFEVLVCVSISMKMLEYGQFLNTNDWISVYLSVFFAAILLSYIVFLLYFACRSQKQMVEKAQGEKFEENAELRKSVQRDLLKRSMSIDPSREKEVRKFFKSNRRAAQEFTKKASTINEAQFEKFAPLTENLRTDSLLAVYNNVLITVRRVLMLYLAMFILGHQWLQVLSFMVMNVVSMCFLLHAKPFDSKLMNNLSLFNEGMALVTSYFIA